MQPWQNTAILIVVQLFMLVGLGGLVIPIFSGIVVIWLAALGYGVLKGFGALGAVLFALITVLMLVGVVVDNVLMGLGARKQGASWLSIGVAVVAGVIGTFAWPPFGGLVGAPLSFMLLEYRRLGDWDKTWQSLRGLATGWGLSFVVRFGIGLLMMGLWWVWVWKG